jgi:hypothetical protein
MEITRSPIPDTGIAVSVKTTSSCDAPTGILKPNKYCGTSMFNEKWDPITISQAAECTPNRTMKIVRARVIRLF